MIFIYIKKINITKIIYMDHNMFLLLKPERGHLSTTVYIIHIYMYKIYTQYIYIIYIYIDHKDKIKLSNIHT